MLFVGGETDALVADRQDDPIAIEARRNPDHRTDRGIFGQRQRGLFDRGVDAPDHAVEVLVRAAAEVDDCGMTGRSDRSRADQPIVLRGGIADRARLEAGRSSSTSGSSAACGLARKPARVFSFCSSAFTAFPAPIAW